MCDEIILEIPIYLNRMQNPPHFSGEVTLLQYPLRPSSRAYGDQGQLTSVQISSEAPARVKMNYALNPSKDCYDPESSFPLQEQAVISRTLGESATAGLAVGVLADGALTLVPLASVSQLRPSFGHLGPAGGVGVPGASITAKQTHYLELSETLRNQRGEGVAWKAADFYEDDSLEAADLFNSQFVVSAQTSNPLKTQDLSLSAETVEYLHALGGARVTETSTARLNRVGLDKQVEIILKQKVCASFSDDILPALPPNTKAYSSESDIIACLEKIAHLVQGYWVIKSSHTIHRSALWRSRDVLLINLRGGREIKTAALSQFAGSNASEAEIEEMVRPLCVLEPARGSWRFKHAEDRAFITAHQDLVTRQDAAFHKLLMDIKSEKTGEAPQSADLAVAATRELLKTKGATEAEEIKKAIQAKTPEKLISQETVAATLAAAGAVEIRKNWWVHGTTGNVQIDSYRDALVHVFRARDSITKQEILDEFQRITGKQCDLTDHELRKMLKEFSRLDRGRWIFRGIAQP